MLAEIASFLAMTKKPAFVILRNEESHQVALMLEIPPSSE